MIHRLKRVGPINMILSLILYHSLPQHILQEQVLLSIPRSPESKSLISLKQDESCSHFICLFAACYSLPHLESGVKQEPWRDAVCSRAFQEQLQERQKLNRFQNLSSRKGTEKCVFSFAHRSEIMPLLACLMTEVRTLLVRQMAQGCPPLGQQFQVGKELCSRRHTTDSADSLSWSQPPTLFEHFTLRKSRHTSFSVILQQK